MFLVLGLFCLRRSYQLYEDGHCGPSGSWLIAGLVIAAAAAVSLILSSLSWLGIL